MGQIYITILSFILTMILIFFRPKGLNEAYSATIGALLVIISGTVTFSDLFEISSKVSGAAITILATIVMVMVLESFGFFHWTAAKLLDQAKGSGIRLFVFTNLLCFLMTLFFNNDGSILITTPILILLLKHLQLKNQHKIPYLLSGALIATASSTPIGVSNIVNLISLKIVNIDLYRHSLMMFVPGILGLLFLFFMLLAVFFHTIPKTLAKNSKITEQFLQEGYHPLSSKNHSKSLDKNGFMKKIFIFVFSVRLSLFVASYIGIPIAIVAVVGSLALLGWRWYTLKIPPNDIFKKTPWHILLFAFSMYIIIYGLHNIGLTDLLVHHLEPIASKDLFSSILVMGSVVSLLSNLFNNHPALMIGTLSITEMGVNHSMMEAMYLANIVGSDIGSLILPIGTLATLLWMHILKINHVKIKWTEYVKVTIVVIPPTVIFTLLFLYLWMEWLFV